MLHPSSLLLLLAASLLTGCVKDATSPEPGPTTVWSDSAWSASKPDVFTYTYTVTCFCPDDDPYLIVSTKDSVVNVRRRLENGDTVLVTADMQFYSIDSIFARFNRQVASGPTTSHLEYDSVYGFPVRASVAPKPAPVDAWFSFSITDFKDHLTWVSH